jgi:hypothetical protein
MCQRLSHSHRDLYTAPTNSILSSSYYLHVGRVAAKPNLAQVVDSQSLRYRANQFLVRGPMSITEDVILTVHTIAAWRLAGGPKPARLRLVYLAPESIHS